MSTGQNLKGYEKRVDLRSFQGIKQKRNLLLHGLDIAAKIKVFLDVPQVSRTKRQWTINTSTVALQVNF